MWRAMRLHSPPMLMREGGKKGSISVESRDYVCRNLQCAAHLWRRLVAEKAGIMAKESHAVGRVVTPFKVGSLNPGRTGLLDVSGRRFLERRLLGTKRGIVKWAEEMELDFLGLPAIRAGEEPPKVEGWKLEVLGGGVIRILWSLGPGPSSGGASGQKGMGHRSGYVGSIAGGGVGSAGTENRRVE